MDHIAMQLYQMLQCWLVRPFVSTTGGGGSAGQDGALLQGLRLLASQERGTPRHSCGRHLIRKDLSPNTVGQIMTGASIKRMSWLVPWWTPWPNTICTFHCGSEEIQTAVTPPGTWQWTIDGIPFNGSLRHRAQHHQHRQYVKQQDMKRIYANAPTRWTRYCLETHKIPESVTSANWMAH